MAITYTSQAIVSYNASPPADDGSTATTNEVTWAGIKTKLADPIKTLAEAINTEIINLASKGAGVTATNTFTLAQYFSDSITVGTGTEDADGSIVASRLRVGPTATEPSAGHLVLSGGIRMGTATEPAAGQIVAAGLQFGVTATAPSTSHMAIVGGIRMGTATEPTAGHIAAIGVHVGPTATEVSSGHIRLTGGLGAGTATQPAAGRVNAVQLMEGGNRVQFTKIFTSTDIAMSASSLITLAHSLATTPKLVHSYLYTPTPLGNFAATDRLFFIGNVYSDATNVFLGWGTGTNAFTVNDKNSGTDVVIPSTSTGWFMVIRAFA